MVKLDQNNNKNRNDNHNMFSLKSNFTPAGDQPSAIKELISGIKNKEKDQVLLGVTGSGKTFTITGGPERYVDRGIIPRSLTMMFEQMKERTGAQFQMHISYLEIYNNTGYDLLGMSFADALYFLLLCSSFLFLFFLSSLSPPFSLSLSDPSHETKRSLFFFLVLILFFFHLFLLLSLSLFQILLTKPNVWKIFHVLQ